MRKTALCALIVSAFLSACGGGGGDDATAAPRAVVAPPTTQQTFTASAAEAGSAAQGAVAAAARAAELSSSLGQGPLPLTGASRSGPMNAGLAQALRTPLREQAQARETVGCADFVGIAGCTGSVTIETDLSENSTVAAPGSHIAITFNALRADDGSGALALDGLMRIDFLTSFSLNSMSFANQRMNLTLDGFGGRADGIAFGPYNALALMEFDASERSTITIDGDRVQRVENVNVTDALNFNLSDVALRRAAWSSAAAYFDYTFGNWSVANGRPSAGSTASIAGAAGSTSIAVTAVAASSVTFDVRITIGAVTTRYTVTAVYPAGGGAPTYGAVQIPG